MTEFPFSIEYFSLKSRAGVVHKKQIKERGMRSSHVFLENQILEMFLLLLLKFLLHQTQNRIELFVEAIQNNPFRSSAVLLFFRKSTSFGICKHFLKLSITE